MSDRLTPEGRAEIRRLLDEATDMTPGEWEEGDGWIYTLPVHEEDNRLANVLGMEYADLDLQQAERKRGQRNAALIVALRNNAEALLDAADERDKWREEAENQHNKAMGLEYDAENGEGLLRQLRAERDQLRADNDRLGRELTARGLGHVAKRGDA